MATTTNGHTAEVGSGPIAGGLHAKLAQAAAEVGTIPMLGQMTGGAGNYSFHRAADVFNAVRKAFYERGVTIVLNHVAHEVKEVNLSNGRVMRIVEGGRSRYKARCGNCALLAVARPCLPRSGACVAGVLP